MIMVLLYIKQTKVSSSNLLAQWHNTLPTPRWPAVRTVGNVEILTPSRNRIFPKTVRQASTKYFAVKYLFGLNHGGQKGAAAGSILHYERPILRCAHGALCCLMHCQGLGRDSTIGLNQASQHGHGYGRVEADPMVVAFLRFAR